MRKRAFKHEIRGIYCLYFAKEATKTKSFVCFMFNRNEKFIKITNLSLRDHRFEKGRTNKDEKAREWQRFGAVKI